MSTISQRQLKKTAWYIGIISLMPIGLIVGLLTTEDQLGGSLLLLGLVLTILLSYLDGNNEFYPDREWKVDRETGRRYRLIGAGSNIRIEYHVEDILNSAEFKRHVIELRRLESEGRIGPLRPPMELGGVEQ